MYDTVGIGFYLPFTCKVQLPLSRSQKPVSQPSVLVSWLTLGFTLECNAVPCSWLLFFYNLRRAGVLVSFPVTVIKCPTKKNLREKGFILVDSSEFQSITAGESRWQEPEAAKGIKLRAERIECMHAYYSTHFSQYFIFQPLNPGNIGFFPYQLNKQNNPTEA